MNRVRSWLAVAGTMACDLLRRLIAATKLHPVRAALVLPGLMLLYVLALIPFTPSVADLRKAKSATPSTVLSADGVVLAEFKRINREWVPLERISPHVIDALIATEVSKRVNVVGNDDRECLAAPETTPKPPSSKPTRQLRLF